MPSFEHAGSRLNIGVGMLGEKNIPCISYRVVVVSEYDIRRPDSYSKAPEMETVVILADESF